MPCTVIILDEVQQYIGDDTSRSYVVQEVVEACSKRFGDRLLFLGTGQTALSGTPALQRLQGRFTVNVELSDTDVETVTRRVVLAKRSDRVNDVKATLDGNAGELDRHLVGTKIGPRSEDQSVLVEDYPLLPVRRRFWEHALRAVDRAGTAGQLRTQLRIVYDAIRRTADDPLGTVVPADFLFEEISASLLQSGVLLREVNETIASQHDGSPDGRLKSRLCALVFLIRKLPREAGVDIGVRATAAVLADLLVTDLAKDGASLRGQLPKQLDELVATGTLMKLDDEYSLQTRESSEWEAEFRNRQTKLVNDPTRMSSKRAQLLGAAVQGSMGSVKLLHGQCKEPRKLAVHFGADPPQGTTHETPVWIRDGWGADEKSVIADARAAGPDSPIIHVFVPKSRADALARVVAAQSAAKDTLEYKGVPSTPEGIEARQGMETRLTEANNSLRALVAEVVDGAKVYQGGGSERLEATLLDKVKEAANASLDRLFYDFKDADDDDWPKVIERARKGAEHPLEVLDYSGKTEDHPVCSAVLSFVGSGKKGKDVRAHFSDPPYGWSRDAVDAALISLLGTGHLRATTNGTPLKPGQLDQAKISGTDFRVESATINTRQRLKIRKLITTVGVACKPNEEAAAAGEFLSKLSDLARSAGGEAPLPERPDTSHLVDLRSLAGNEQLVGILNRHDELLQNIEDWTKARDLAEKRLPPCQRLQCLARHANGLDAAKKVQPQIDALAANRSLLDTTDPVPDLTKALADALRAALAEAEKHYAEVFDEESTRLESAESWQTIEQSDRDRILKGLNIAKATKGVTGTGQEVLESLERMSLDAWRTRTAALPQFFAEAHIQADKLLHAAYGDDWHDGILTKLLAESGSASLDDWLRDQFFEEHCKLFQHRPFIWHIWDGRKRDGFHALVNYHKLAEGDGKGRRLLESLTYSYLGDWISRQQDGVKRGDSGAEDRLAAALELQKRLVAILEGQPPFDLFVRWKPIEEQSIGWEPDINDDVRLNIRPFMAQDLPCGKKGSGVLRAKPNIHWKKDRGKEPTRDQGQFPWFWENGTFTGERVNDVHLANAEKRAALEAVGSAETRK